MGQVGKIYIPEFSDFQEEVRKNYLKIHTNTPIRRLTLGLFTQLTSSEEERRELIYNSELAEEAYILNKAIAIVHGPNASAEQFEGHDGERVGTLVKYWRDQLQETYKGLNITKGPATFKRQLQELDKIAVEIAEKLQPGCSKGK